MKSYILFFALVVLANWPRSQGSPPPPKKMTVPRPPEKHDFLFFSTDENRRLADEIEFRLYNNKSDVKMYNVLKYGDAVSVFGVLCRTEAITSSHAYESTKILIDGFTTSDDSLETDFIEDTKNAYLRNPVHHNVIVMSWTKLSYKPLKELNKREANPCSNSTRNVWVAGERLGNVLIWLRKNSLIDFARTHVVAFSPAAHIAGRAGEMVLREFGEPLKRITALAPMGLPYYGCKSTRLEHLLKPSDARYVDAYHTDMDSLGIFENVGWSDVYLNIGVQPECISKESNPSNISTCSHKLAAKFWPQTIGSTGAPRDQDEGLCATSKKFDFPFGGNGCEKKIRVGEYATLKTTTYGDSSVIYNIGMAGTGLNETDLNETGPSRIQVVRLPLF